MTEQWYITWRDADGVELEGWYNGSRRQARAWAQARMVALGAVGFELTS